MKIAAAQYPVSFQASWDEYTHKLERWVSEAAQAGAQLLVFPEYAPMELASLFEPAVQQDVQKQLPALQDLLEPYRALHARLARTHGVYVVAGSFPVWLEERGVSVNRAFVFAPDGSQSHQDKLIMTRFERDDWGISSGTGFRVFTTPHGCFAVLICYDSEFPQLARRMVEAGADVIVVPSCTDTLTGYHRVQVGSRARALENQCFTVQAPLVGTSDWCETIDVCMGAAGVYTPIDRGYPDSGVLVQGELDQPGWVYADLDLLGLREARENGQTLNYRHWLEGEAQAREGGIEVIRL